MGDMFGSSNNFGLGVLGDPFTSNAEDKYQYEAERASRLPPELEQLMNNMLLPLLKARISGGTATPFVQPPEAPTIGMTPTEEELSRMGLNLARTVGTQPLQEAFQAGSQLRTGAGLDMPGADLSEAMGGARRLAGESLDLGTIASEVTPRLSPAIQNLIEKERAGRLQLGEELTAQGGYIGSPLVEGQRRLATDTNRNIAEMVSNAVMQERGLRGGEVATGVGMLGTYPVSEFNTALAARGERAGELGTAAERLLRTGAAAPILASQYASLPRDITTQQYGLSTNAATNRMNALQQVFDLLLGGISAGTSQYGTRAGTLMSGQNLVQRQKAAEMQFLSDLISSASKMG